MIYPGNGAYRINVFMLVEKLFTELQLRSAKEIVLSYECILHLGRQSGKNLVILHTFSPL